MNETFLTDLNPDKINEVVRSTENNVDYFTTISDKIVTSVTTDLENLMLRIKQNTVGQDVSDDDLEQFIMELSNLLYFMGSRLENMGIKDDLSKIAAKEVYNNAYIDMLKTENKKPTVAELSAKSDDISKYETIMNTIYSRAYKQIKFKIDAAYEMLNSLRKIITKRMQEAQLSSYRHNDSVVIGTEEF